jgi:hypothetical protein
MGHATLLVGAKRGARVGGRTGQYLLRLVGKERSLISPDVAVCLCDAGPRHRREPHVDMRTTQDQFNAWAMKSGLPLIHPSRTCAMSIGGDYDAATLRERAATGDCKQTMHREEPPCFATSLRRP